jgi:hypothetical protein
VTGELTPRLLRNFQLIEAAALAGQRCPRYQPRGPLDPNAVTGLFERGWLLSEVYNHHFRRVVVLKGDHAGASTAPPPDGASLVYINGRKVSNRRALIRGEIALRSILSPENAIQGTSFAVFP